MCMVMYLPNTLIENMRVLCIIIQLAAQINPIIVLTYVLISIIILIGCFNLCIMSTANNSYTIQIQRNETVMTRRALLAQLFGRAIVRMCETLSRKHSNRTCIVKNQMLKCNSPPNNVTDLNRRCMINVEEQIDSKQPVKQN